MYIYFKELNIIHNDDGTHTLSFAWEFGVFKQKFDNMDTLWRAIGKITKGDKI